MQMLSHFTMAVGVILALGCGLVVRQGAEHPSKQVIAQAATAKKVEKPTSANAQIDRRRESDDARLKAVDASLKTMRSVLSTALSRLAQTRKDKDVNALNCVNEKLAAIDGLVKISEDAQVALKEAIARRDAEGKDHEVSKVALADRRVAQLRLEVEGCVGEMTSVAEKANGLESQAVTAEASLGKTDPVVVHFRAAQDLVGAGSYEKAGTSFLDLADRYPNHKLVPNALFSAVMAYEELDQFQAAASAYKRIVNDYSESNFAQMYVRRGFEPEGCVPSETNSGASRIRDYLMAECYRRHGNLKQAAESFSQFVNRYPNEVTTSPTTEDGLIAAVDLYQFLKKDPPVRQLCKPFLKGHRGTANSAKGVLNCLMHEARFSLREGKGEAARNAYGEVVSEFERYKLEAGSPLAALAGEAAFHLVEFELSAFERLKIQGTQERQLETLKTLLNTSKTLQRRYNRVYRYKFMDWLVAAEYRKSYLDHLFAEKVENAPTPKSIVDMGADAEKQWRSALDEQVERFEGRAISRLRMAYRQIEKRGIQTEWANRVKALLSTLAPDEFRGSSDTN